MRFSCVVEGEDDVVLEDHTLDCAASERIRFPVLRSERVDFFPLTGWSRFGVQTRVCV